MKVIFPSTEIKHYADFSYLESNLISIIHYISLILNKEVMDRVPKDSDL